MDLSKLPRLSQTDPAPPAGGPPQDPPPQEPRRRQPAYDDDAGGGLGALMEIWLSAGLGVLFVFLGWSYGKYLLKIGDPYPVQTDTGMVWQEGSPKAGQKVAPEELEEPFKTQYKEQQQARVNSIRTDSSLLLFGVVLLLDALIVAVARLAPLPAGTRRGLVRLAIAATAGVTLYELYVVVALMRAGMLPQMTFLCLLVGGFVLFTQVSLLRVVSIPAAAPVPAPTPAADPVSHFSRILDAQPRARCTHYKFAHQALRQVAFENPRKCVGMLQSAGAQKFLNDLWDAVRDSCAQSGEAGGESAADSGALEADLTQVGPYAGALVRLPAPRFVTEAYFVLPVVRSYTRADGFVVDRDPLLLYFLLERGEDAPGGEVRTVLSEWQAGARVNYGEGPSPDASAFREAVAERVNALQKREDDAAGKTAFV